MAYHIMRVWLSLNGTVMALHCLFTPQRSQGDLWDLPSYKQFLAPAVIIYKILFPFLGVSLILVCIPFHISDGLSQWMDILCQINLFSFFFFATLLIAFPLEAKVYLENSLRKPLMIERSGFSLLHAQTPDSALRNVIFRWNIKLKPWSLIY